MVLQHIQFKRCSLIHKEAFKDISSMSLNIGYEHLLLLCKFCTTDFFIGIYEYKLLFISFTIKFITD